MLRFFLLDAASTVVVVSMDSGLLSACVTAFNVILAMLDPADMRSLTMALAVFSFMMDDDVLYR